MKVNWPQNLPKLPSGDVSPEDILNHISILQSALLRIFSDIVREMNGRLSLGDGTDLENIFGDWVTFTSHAVADTEFSVAHNTARIPAGFIVISQNKAGSLYKGATAWTNSTLYLKSNVSSLTATILVI